ncbi:molybdate ABC transporter substrate-binding protein [Azorhizobium doebereinerae]|uniref:molybdate ABC transporter substrate-binding protein n=1 Tax=Azorhizobium doebereinerae TaxID=281091 RepID=UPI0003F70E6A|nr:molybdate ABC transporter substrate-binding protein [Azorhizobium doebereinerae]
MPSARSMIRAACAVALLAAPVAARAEEVALYAAGSLSGALGEVATAYTKATGTEVRGTFGPSGLLRERLEKGEPGQVFASADMGHPRKLVAEGAAPVVVRFTGNRLCAIAKPALGLTPGNVLDKALDPAVRLGTSTPKSDPSGDYTWAMFDKADALRPGAGAALKEKALQLVGGPNSEVVPAGKSAVPYMIETGKADLFIAYCTTARAASDGAPLTVVDLPAPLATTADYGLVVMKGAPPAAADFALFIVSEPGQAILAKWGFASLAQP